MSVSDKTYNQFRIIDLSSVDEVAKRWNGKIFKCRDSNSSFKYKERTYRAEDNLIRAVERLKFYKENLFNVKEHKHGHHGHHHHQKQHKNPFKFVK